MKLFGRKTAKGGPFGFSGLGAGQAGKADGIGHAGSASRRLTRDLAHAETFAVMLANSRASKVIEAADLLAGMYICDWDRLSKYWEEEDQEQVEDFLRQICRISPQRWHYWIQFYVNQRREGEERPSWRSLLRLKKAQPNDKTLRPSADLESVLKQAEEIAPFRETAAGGTIPILTSECVLLCIARNYGSEISRKLAETRLDVTRLEQSALDPRRAPLH